MRQNFRRVRARVCVCGHGIVGAWVFLGQIHLFKLFAQSTCTPTFSGVSFTYAAIQRRMGDTTMPVITIKQDFKQAANTVVTVTWDSGECFQYTIAANPMFDGHDATSFEDCMAYNVYITGYCNPEDGLGFEEYPIDRAECAQQCETEMDAIEFCIDCHS
jgi:hypothetical protein